MAANKEEINSFEREIDRIVTEKDFNVIEAITHYCASTGMEIDACTKLISKTLKTKITSEAQKLHLIKQRKRK